MRPFRVIGCLPFVAPALLWPDPVAARQVTVELLAGISQAHYQREYRLPVPGGPGGASQAWFSDVEGTLGSATGGLALIVPVAGPVSLRAEATAVRKGFDGPDRSFKAYYLEVPLLLEVTLPTWDGHGLHGIVGVAPSRELSCSAEIELPAVGMEWYGPPVRWPLPCNGYRDARRDLGFVFGGGLGAFSVAGWPVTAEVRLVQGYANLRNAENGSIRALHSTWSFLLRVAP